MKKFLYLLCAALLLMPLLCACDSAEPGITPVNESYKFTPTSDTVYTPSLVVDWSFKYNISTETKDGTFRCFTSDATQATTFINSQRTLLKLLQRYGIDTEGITYFGTDYSGSFSESSKNEVYIDLDDMGTWKQVLATLQTFWGDYADYGYLYPIANTLAEELGWETDPIPSVKKVVMNAFFTDNPEALQLLYPSFTTEYADQETVDYCKVLSTQLFKKVDLGKVLTLPIEEQLDTHHERIGSYAKKLGIEYAPLPFGYSYCGEDIPLRIMTDYARMLVDDDFAKLYMEEYTTDTIAEEHYDELYRFFADYKSIYKVTEIFNSEITAGVARFGLEDKAGVVDMRWLSSESANKLYGKSLKNHYRPSDQTITLTILTAWLHEYYHHLHHTITPDADGNSFTGQAFAEIGRLYSQHSMTIISDMMTNTPELAEAFLACTGRHYAGGKEDYLEAYDVLSYCCKEFDYDNALMGRNPTNSMLHYLFIQFGEDVTTEMLIFPDTVKEVTEKTWDQLGTEWEEWLKNKYEYEGAEIPDLTKLLGPG